MKRNWIRLLSILLTAVMIFPATAFAAGGDDGETPEDISITLYVDETEDLPQVPDGTISWVIADTSVVSIADGKATGLKEGSTIARPMDANYNTFGPVYSISVKTDKLTGIEITGPSKKSYREDEALDISDLTVTEMYESGRTNTLSVQKSEVTPKEASLDMSKMKAGTHTFTVSHAGFTKEFSVDVSSKSILSITILSDKTDFETGDLISNLTIRVNYDNGTYEDVLSTSSDVKITLNGTTTANRKLVETDTSYWVTYKEIYTDHRDITVKAASGSGSGSGTTDPEKLTVKVTKQPTKKDYTIGEKFDPTGMEIQFVKADNTVAATIPSGDAFYSSMSYTFKPSDKTTGNNTISLSFPVTYLGKSYTVSVSGLKVSEALNTLEVDADRYGAIKNFEVVMLRKSYPNGTTFSLKDIDYIAGRDVNNKSFLKTYSQLADYSNRFSIEVLSVDSRGETSRKSSSYRQKLEERYDTFEKSGKKYFWLRFYIDDYYYDFEWPYGDSGLGIYYGTTLLDSYDDIIEALEDANDPDRKWQTSSSGSASTIADTRTLTLKISEDTTITQRYGRIEPERNIEIDTNGKNLTLYTDSFVFNRNNKYKVTVTNTSTTSSKVTYGDESALSSMILAKGDTLTFEYNSDSNAPLPGTYTITISETKYGAVTSKPEASRNGTITVSHGNEVTFTVTPDKDYQIDTVKTQKGKATATTVSNTTNSSGYSLNASTGVATYTLKDIKSDYTFTATFKAVEKKEEAKIEKEWVNPFEDVATYAGYYEAVKYVNQKGLMNGLTSNSFGSNRTMTRAQFVTTLGRMYLGSVFETTAQKDNAMIQQYGTNSKFADVSYNDASISYAVPYITWAEQEGLIQGYGNGKFGPQDTITHQQMYIIMYRYAQNLARKNISVSSVSLLATDANKLGEGWLAAAKEGAVAAAKYAQQQNFLVSTMTIDPNGNALRYELATLIMLFSKNVLGWE